MEIPEKPPLKKLQINASILNGLKVNRKQISERSGSLHLFCQFLNALRH